MKSIIKTKFDYNYVLEYCYAYGSKNSQRMYWVKTSNDVWWCILPTGQRKNMAVAEDHLILHWIFIKQLKLAEKIPFEEVWHEVSYEVS